MKRILRAKKLTIYSHNEREALMKDLILFYQKLGFNLIPIADGTKQPIANFDLNSHYDGKKSTEEQIQDWFFTGSTRNVGIVCGKTSNYLVVIDIDNEKNWQKLKPYFPITLTIGTSRGVQLYYFSDRLVKSRKFSELEMEIRAERNYVVAPPSLHPSGVSYTIISRPESGSPITTITGDFQEEFLKIVSKDNELKEKAQKLHDKVNVMQLMNGVKQGSRNEAAIRIASWFRKRGITKDEALKQLILWNGKNQPPFEGEELTQMERTLNSAYDKEPYEYNFGDEEIGEREFWTAEEIEKANQILNSPDVILYVKKALGDVVGNEKFKVTLFLINLKCENAHVLGDTATGKSHIADRVLRCFPLDTWFKITGVTDKAIRYLGTDIKHLYLAEWGAIGKKEEESTAAYDVKIIMSEGCLDLLVVCKDEHGMLKTQHIKTHIKNMVTTQTSVEVPKEMLNRAFETGPEKKTAEVVKFTLEQEEKTEDRIDNEPERHLLRCAIEILETETADFDFVIPYATKLYKIFDPLTERARTTRDVKKLCNLIKASALLHYRNRPIFEGKNGKKYLVCLPEDFANAWTYGDEACIGTFVELTKRGEEIFELCKKLLINKKELTTNNLASIGAMTKQGANDWLHKFEHFGMLVMLSEKKGATKFYELPEKANDQAICIKIEMNSLYAAFEEWKAKHDANSVSSNQPAKQENKKYFNKIFEVRFPACVLASERLRLLPDKIEYSVTEEEKSKEQQPEPPTEQLKKGKWKKKRFFATASNVPKLTFEEEPADRGKEKEMEG